jgi:4-hydroxymandelate oxidase
LPVLIAPTAFQRMAHPDGEVASARAAAAEGTIMTLSSIASSTIEEVAQAAPGAPQWFQLYVYRDRGVTKELVERAVAAGYSGLVLTVDTPVLGLRDRDTRNQFRLPEGVELANLASLGAGTKLPSIEGSGLFEWVIQLQDPSVTWADIEWLRSVSSLPLILKGVMTAEDAQLATEHGLDALIVSNHGGRQLDGTRATVSALPEVVDAVDGRLEVLVDGGIRRGSDILKALALGARAVLIGRPVLWGLAAGGEQGVRAVLDMLRRELDVAMAIAGCRTPEQAGPSLIVRGAAKGQFGDGR